MSARKTTPEQDEVICERYRGGEPMHRIAPDYGVSTGAIGGVLRRHDVKMRSVSASKRVTAAAKTALVEAAADEIVAAYRSGTTYRELCKRYNTKGHRITKILDDHGLKPHGRGGHRKFTDAEEQAIAEAYESGTSSGSLARQYSCSVGLVRRIATDHGKIIAGRGNWFRTFPDELIDRVLQLRTEKLSTDRIAEIVELPEFQVRRIVNDNGMCRRWLRAPQSGYEASHKPGEYVFEALARDDPFLPTMARANGYVQQHRLVMARHLGRPLRKDESVHHINGIRDDNRIENLQLRQGQHGKGVVAQCADCGSYNVTTTKLKESGG